MLSASEVTVTLPSLFDWQTEVKAHPAKRKVVAIGRQAGKSELGMDGCAEMALDGAPSAFLAQTNKAMLDAWQTLRHRLGPATEHASQQTGRITLATGGLVDFWSLDRPATARGRQYALMAFDEVAHVPGFMAAWHAVFSPMLSIRGGAAWFFSTPLGLNDFHTLYQWGRGERDGWHSWQMPSSVSPMFTDAMMAEADEALPDRVYAQEHLATFLTDGGAVFRNVKACATAEPEEPVDGRSYLVGCDWGKHNDFTVLCVLDVQGRRVVHVDRFNRIDYSLQRDRLRHLHTRYNRAAIVAERNAMGEPIIEELRRTGLPVQAFTTTNASKAEAIEALALAFERGDIAIPDDDVLTGELMAFTAKRLPSGMLRYEAPSGMHDDTVMALAIAWHGLGHTIEGPLMV